VIYGDTDSVMIRFGSTERDAPEGHGDAQSWMIQHAMDAAIDAANHVNETFIRPIKLEFEKVYYPYLLMNKKRYAALLWTNPSKFDKMDCKGIETVRRDNCGLVRTVIDASLRMILVERAPERAVEFVKSSVRDLLMGRVDISELIITKALNKTLENSKSPQVFSRAHPPISAVCVCVAHHLTQPRRPTSSSPPGCGSETPARPPCSATASPTS
jgi:DNA polymerase delta subunit 1